MEHDICQLSNCTKFKPCFCDICQNGQFKHFSAFSSCFLCFVLLSFDNNSISWNTIFVNNFLKINMPNLINGYISGKNQLKNFCDVLFYQHMLIFLYKTNNKSSLYNYNTLLNIKEKTRSFDLWISSYEPIICRAVKCIYCIYTIYTVLQSQLIQQTV